MPHPDLATPRTRLSPVVPDDADELLGVFRDPVVRRHLLDDTLVDHAWVAAEIDSSRERFERDGTGLFTVRRPGDPRIVGFVGFREFFEPPRLQLLYGLVPDQHGRGLATEAAAAVCDLGLDDLGLGSIEAATDPPNAASVRVLEWLGMCPIPSPVAGAGDSLFFALDPARAFTAGPARPRIREATRGDVDPIVDLQARYYAVEGYPHQPSRARSAVATLLDDAALGFLLVARDRDRFLGYAAVCFGFSLEHGGRDAFVDEVCVRDGARGSGVGTLLLEVAAERACASGVRTLHLEVEPENAKAVRLYRRLGFEDHGRRLMNRRLDTPDTAPPSAPVSRPEDVGDGPS